MPIDVCLRPRLLRLLLFACLFLVPRLQADGPGQSWPPGTPIPPPPPPPPPPIINPKQPKPKPGPTYNNPNPEPLSPIVAPVAPFESPLDLFNRLRKHLGFDSSPGELGAPIPSSEELKAQLKKLRDDERQTLEGKRKTELRAAIKDLESDLRSNRFLDEAKGSKDYSIRRRVFISDTVDSLQALATALPGQEWSTIYRCGIERTLAEMKQVLKAFPAVEVAPFLWQKLEEQIRFSGAMNEQGRIGELETQANQVREQILALQTTLKGAAEGEDRTRLLQQVEELSRKFRNLQFDRTIASAAASGLNGKFKLLMRELLVELGPEALIPLLTDNKVPNREVCEEADRIIKAQEQALANRLQRARERQKEAARDSSLLGERASKAADGVQGEDLKKALAEALQQECQAGLELKKAQAALEQFQNVLLGNLNIERKKP